jgi:hypothetical protein
MTTKVDVYKITVDVKNAETIGQMEEGIKNLRKELKDKKVGSDEFNELSKAIGEAEGKLSEMTEQSQQAGKKVGGAFQKAGKTIEAGFKGAMGASMLFAGSSEESIKLMAKLQGAMQLKEGIAGIMSSVKSMGLLNTAIGGASKAANILKIAIVSTGIGAFIVVLGSLVAWFTKTTEGMEKLNTALNVVSGVIDAIVDRIVKFGGAIVKFLSGDFKGGIEDMGNAFKGVGDAIQENIKRAQELSAMQNKLKKEEVDFIKVKAKQNEIIAEARAIIQDETESIENKRKALKDMSEAQDKLLNEEIRQQEVRVKILKMQQEQSTNNIKDNKELAEAEANLMEIKTQSANLSRTILKAEKTVNAEAKAQERERLQAMQERVNKEIELEKRRLEVMEQLTEGDEKRFLERRKKAGMISTEEYNIAIMEVQKKWAGIRKAEQDKAEKEAEQARKERDAEIAQRRSDELKQFDDHINVNRLALLVQYQNGEIATREEYEQRVQELELEALRERREILLEHGVDTTDISIEIANKEVAIVEEKNNKILESEKAIKDAKVKLLGDTFKMFEKLNEGFTKDEEKREKIRKAIAVGEIATDTALAISAAVKASSANPANAVTGGAAGAVQLAATLVKIGTNIGAAMAILRSGNPSGVPSGDGGMPSPGTSPQTSPIFNIRETQTQPQQQRVYVVEDDIRGMQDRVNGYNRVAIID